MNSRCSFSLVTEYISFRSWVTGDRLDPVESRELAVTESVMKRLDDYNEKLLVGPVNSRNRAQIKHRCSIGPAGRLWFCLTECHVVVWRVGDEMTSNDDVAHNTRHFLWRHRLTSPILKLCSIFCFLTRLPAAAQRRRPEPRPMHYGRMRSAAGPGGR